MSLGFGPISSAPISALPQINPVRIVKISLCDFRAFAGPEPVTIDLKGKNLLVYGENGAGKSSIFHALDEFFAFPTKTTNAVSRRAKLSTLANKFRQVATYRIIRDFWYPEGTRNVEGAEVPVPIAVAQNAYDDGALELLVTGNDAYVEVTFDNSENAIRWDKSGHPVDTSTGSTQTVTNAAFKKVVLDYRSLLETNFRHGSGKINLFDVMVNVLLRDYAVSSSTGQTTLVVLWHEMQDILTAKQIRNRELERLNDLRVSFNTGLRTAIDQLLPLVNPLLDDLGWKDLRLVGLSTPGVTYNNAKSKEARKLEGAEINPRVAFASYRPDTPQVFLNEARLSALALAIFFAGRMLCANTLQPNTPRLMVLDDVLIGLDQSNRLPVLDVISKRFSGWQVILLTHDRVWFEMARLHLDMKEGWTSLEMFEGKEPSGVVRPVLRPTNSDPVVDNLKKADTFHSANEYAAAAVHARVAFEHALKKLCGKKAIPVPFSLGHIDLKQFLEAVKTWLDTPRRKEAKKALDPVVQKVETCASVILNSFAHSSPVTLSGKEVADAIESVKAFHAEAKKLYDRSHKQGEAPNDG
jgi:energy-coupling factor transporter ATP-binding protein EcfA2